ncbi:MAG: L-malate glycosyltransferase [Thermoanaerobacter sp.]|jgi:glycosyltransferase involved in cell wall biosynthesis|nr:L-malate glycosyltransferase [Thermoanaerobacter sp.]
MKVLVGTALGMGAGGVKSHIESLRHSLLMKNIYTELVYPDSITRWWKIMAVTRALGSIDRARVELTKIRVNNVWKKCKKIISRTKNTLDLIHTHDVLLASRASGFSIPVVLTVHGPLSREAVMLGKGTPTYLTYLKQMEQKAYECAKIIIAVDTGQKEIIVTDYNISPEKVRVIYNAVDTDLFAPQLQNKDVERPYFLVPRRLVPKNGVHVAIKAFQLLADLEAELWIAGEGPEQTHLEKLAKQLNLTARVRFLGSIERKDMIHLISAAFGIIIPSVPTSGVIEATSIAALEGMSAGKPVFASNIGGLAEIINDEETGLLFEPGDHKTLGILLRRALANIEWSRNIGEKAREYVVKNHSLEVWVKEIIQVYHDALRN